MVPAISPHVLRGAKRLRDKGFISKLQPDTPSTGWRDGHLTYRFTLPSEDGTQRYSLEVRSDGTYRSCSCEGSNHGGRLCKHLALTLIHLGVWDWPRKAERRRAA